MISGLLTGNAWQFTTDGNAGIDAGIGDVGMGLYYDPNDTSAVYLAYDDSGANVNDNHDDFIVKVTAQGLTVSQVPVPASAALFLSAAAGFGLMRRKGALQVDGAHVA